LCGAGEVLRPSGCWRSYAFWMRYCDGRVDFFTRFFIILKHNRMIDLILEILGFIVIEDILEGR